MFWKSKPWRVPVPSSSDSIASTLITLAPISLSWRTAVGPDRARVRSMTLMCDRARPGSGIVEDYVTNDGATLDCVVGVGDLFGRSLSLVKGGRHHFSHHGKRTLCTMCLGRCEGR